MIPSRKVSCLNKYILSSHLVICLYFLSYVLTFTFTKLSSKTLAPITSPNVTVVVIIANGIPTIGMNDNPISAPANNIAIGYLLYRRMILNLFHFLISLE